MSAPNRRTLHYAFRGIPQVELRRHELEKEGHLVTQGCASEDFEAIISKVFCGVTVADNRRLRVVVTR
jgi:hypothetical protein